MAVHDLMALVNPSVDSSTADWNGFDEQLNNALGTLRPARIADAIYRHLMATRLSREDERILKLAEKEIYYPDLLDPLLGIAAFVLEDRAE